MRLYAEKPEVREVLLKGKFGLEKESLRVDENGYMAHTPHPFPGDEHIVRDFCENQTEINTPVLKSAKEAVASLEKYYVQIQKKLAELPEREYLWPFSNPPYIPADVIETLMPEVKDYEPRLALEGADEGLEFYKKITEASLEHLNPGGWLFYEIGCEQAEDVSKIMRDKGFKEVHTVRDLAGLDRVVYGRR